MEENIESIKAELEKAGMIINDDWCIEAFRKAEKGLMILGLQVKEKIWEEIGK